MKTAATVATLLSLPGLVLGQTTSPRAHSKSASGLEREVRRASAEEVQALLAGDARRLARLWSSDFVVTNPLNQFVTKAQVLALIESDALAFKSYDRHIEYVHAYGDLVLVAGSETVIWAGRMPMAGNASPLRFTAVWMRSGGRWQEVARHANVVSPPRVLHSADSNR